MNGNTILLRNLFPLFFLANQFFLWIVDKTKRNISNIMYNRVKSAQIEMKTNENYRWSNDEPPRGMSVIVQFDNTCLRIK